MALIARMMIGLALLLAPASIASADDLAKATSLYKQFCAHCHGINMVNPGVSSFDLRKFPVTEKERFETSVMKGRGDMPAWGDILLPEELELLWIYVATRGGKEPLPEPEKQSALPPGKPETIAEGRLTACLPRNGGSTAHIRHGGGGGIDYLVSRALADRLGLELAVTWFESEPEEESDPVRESFALVSHGLCDILPGLPLYPSYFGEPPAATAALPRWLDQPMYWDPATHVKLNPMAATAPYRRAELAIVAGPGIDADALKSLADLGEYRVGIEQGTLAGAILDVQLPPEAKANSIMAKPGPTFLWELEKGHFEVTLADTAAFDFHGRQNRITKLSMGSYRHPIGFNIAIGYPAASANLGIALDEALAGLAASGAFAIMAREANFTFAPPREPMVSPPLTTRLLMSLR